MKLELSEICFTNEVHKKYAIYGTGEIGRMLKRALELLGHTVDIFLCSDGYKKEDKIGDIDVIEFSSFATMKEDYEILLTVLGGAESISKMIKDKINNTVINVNSFEDVLSIHRFYYEYYFYTAGVEIDKEYIDIKGIKFINPFIADNTYAFAFFMECGDLILPALFKDLSCVYEGPYEQDGFMIDKDDIVIDCGSNVGLFSIAVADRCKQVYAFEPVKDIQKYIEKMSKVFDNIHLCDYALSDKVGTVNFSSDPAISSSSHIVNDGSEDENSIIVNVTTIDEFVKQNQINHIDFIKADIEGAERDMLRGAVNTLRQFSPKLSICEYHLPDDPQVLEQIILEANPSYIVKHEHMKIYAYVPE